VERRDTVAAHLAQTKTFSQDFLVAGTFGFAGSDTKR
jgi:hypothetical protein